MFSGGIEMEHWSKMSQCNSFPEADTKNQLLADIPEKNRRGVFRKLLNIYSGTFCEKVNE